MPKSGKGKAMLVTLYNCKGCGNKFRKASRLDFPTSAVSEIGIKSTIASSEGISKNVVAPNVSVEVPIAEAPVLSESTLQMPEKVIASADVAESTRKMSLFERIRRAFTG